MEEESSEGWKAVLYSVLGRLQIYWGNLRIRVRSPTRFGDKMVGGGAVGHTAQVQQLHTLSSELERLL